MLIGNSTDTLTAVSMALDEAALCSEAAKRATSVGDLAIAYKFAGSAADEAARAVGLLYMIKERTKRKFGART